jgi:hypothetical protein
MKLKFKLVAAAAAMLAASAAFADIKGPDDGGSELFLSVWQQAGFANGTASASYTIDLMTTFDQFYAGKSTNLFVNQVINDTYFSQLLAATTPSALQFSLLVGDRIDATDRLISTYSGSSAKPIDNGGLGAGLDAIANFTGALNATGSYVSGPGGASFNNSGASYYQNNSSGGGMNTLYGSSTPNSGLVGSNLTVVKFNKNGTDSLNAPLKEVLPGTFYFGQQNGSYVVQYQVAAVPEPTGIAMMLAGLGAIGFMAIRRKSR